MRCAVLAFVAAIGMAVAGCAGVPIADEALDREAKAFAAKPGRAVVYVFRDDEAGEGVPMEVLLDGVLLGRSAPRTFFAFEAEPGRHAITSRAANAFGPRAFRAPGTVTVFASVSDLRIACRLPGGGGATSVSGGVDAPVPASRAAAEGRATGAKLGAVAGIAAGAASVPVMGPGLAIFIAAGSVARGAEIGGIAGALAAGGQVSYPSPIVLRLVAD